MPYINPDPSISGWSEDPQPDFGMTLYVESVPESIAQPLPNTVTAAQGGIALIRAGLMPAVLAVVNDESTPAEVKWAFEKAQYWDRGSAAFNYIADKAGIQESEKDALFEDAKSILA